MTKFVLHYFDGRARGEIIRLIMAAAGIKYTDNRIDFKAWNEKLKAESPLGQLPYLVIDNKIKLPQSISIARYLAKEFNLAGKDNLEHAKADAVVDTCYDILNAYFGKVFRAENKVAAFEQFRDNDGAKGFKNIETLVNLFGSNGFSVGNSLTWADLYVYEMNDQLFSNAPKLIEKFPKTFKVTESVKSNPNVAVYLKTRKPTKF